MCPGEVEQQAHVLVVEAIPDRAPVAPGPDDSGHPQQPQRLAHRCLGDVDRRRQVADAQLAGLGQGEEDPHPAAVPQQAEEPGQPVGLLAVEQAAPRVGHPGGVDHPDGTPVERGDFRVLRLRRTHPARYLNICMIVQMIQAGGPAWPGKPDARAGTGRTEPRRPT